MSTVRKADVATVAVLAFDFLAALPAGNYPLWTVHSNWLRAWLYTASGIGTLSVVVMPVWVGIRLFREPARRLLTFVEFIGALSWLAAFAYQAVSSFPVI